MGYGNNSSGVKNAVKLIGIPLKNGTVILAAIFFIIGDIFVGQTFYYDQFMNVSDVPLFTLDIPVLGFSASPRWIMGFGTSVIASGVQIILWNFVKSGRGFRNLGPLQLLAVLTVTLLMVGDTIADIGGISSMMGPVREDGVLPVVINYGTGAVLLVSTIACLGGEIFLDNFLDFDKPLMGETTLSRKVMDIGTIRKRRNTSDRKEHTG